MYLKSYAQQRWRISCLLSTESTPKIFGVKWHYPSKILSPLKWPLLNPVFLIQWLKSLFVCFPCKLSLKPKYLGLRKFCSLNRKFNLEIAVLQREGCETLWGSSQGTNWEILFELCLKKGKEKRKTKKKI